MHAPGGTCLGYPKGVFLLSFTELWERFSYFGMLALLVLFLTDNVGDGGFSWDRPDALRLYGFYSGIVFIVPLLGGWIANQYWGERRCILAGGLLIVVGQFLLTGPSVVPWLAQRHTGIDFRALWVAAGVPLGILFPDADTVARLMRAAQGTPLSPVAVQAVYHASGSSFFAGLAAVVAGTALIKPTISSIIGRFYQDGDRRRDAAFAMFFVGIYVGSVTGSLIAGYLGERVAWHWGFAAAGFGMLFGVAAYLRRQDAWLGDVGTAPLRPAGGGAAPRLTPTERDRMKVIFAQGLFTVAYAAAFYQKGGMLTLFANEHVDRRLGDWLIPTTWFLTISTGTFIVLTPLATRLWQSLDQRGANPGAATKLAWGLLALAAGYLVILNGMAPEDAGASTWFGWLVLTYVCFGIGDTLVWPTQISLVTKLAPVRLSALFVGGWYITIGLGSWLTGYIGALAYTWGLRPVFLLLAVATAGLGLLLWLATPRLRALTHGAE
jgi:POT family proton-dependent oligopeptide transporter